MATIHEVMDHMRGERDEPTSPVYGMVDTSRLGLMGHSFGGAATIFSTANWLAYAVATLYIYRRKLVNRGTLANG